MIPLPVIYLVAFLMACGVNALNISMAMFLADVKASGPLIIGLAGFIGNLAVSATAFSLARHPVKNRKNIFIYVPAGAAILYLLLLFSSIPLIFSFLFLAGILYAFFWPSLQSCFGNAKDNFSIGIYNISWSGGVICGALLSGVLYAVNPKAPFILALVLALSAFLILISRKRQLLALKENPPELEKARGTFSPKIVHEIRFLSFMHFFAVSSIFYLYPKMGLNLGFSPQFIGASLAILLVCRFVSFSLLIDKPLLLHPARFIISCTLFFISCFLTGIAGHQHTIIIAVAILGITGAFSYHNSLLLHIKHGFKTEIHEGIIGAGACAGALSAGLLGEIFNLSAAFIIIGAVILVSGMWQSRGYLMSNINRKRT